MLKVIVQRALAARSLSHAQGATIMAGFIKILPLFIMVMPGMMSRVLYPSGCLNMHWSTGLISDLIIRWIFLGLTSLRFNVNNHNVAVAIIAKVIYCLYCDFIF